MTRNNPPSCQQSQRPAAYPWRNNNRPTLGTSGAKSSPRTTSPASTDDSRSLRFRRTNDTNAVATRKPGGTVSPKKTAMKRPVPTSNAGPVGKKAKTSHPPTRAARGWTTTGEPAASRSLGSTPQRRGGGVIGAGSSPSKQQSSGRPGTPDSVRHNDHNTSERVGVRSPIPNGHAALMQSPISRAKREAKVPSLYLSAGATPPPSQVYRSKKRVQKRILVLKGTADECLEEAPDMLLRTPEPRYIAPAPSLDELNMAAPEYEQRVSPSGKTTLRKSIDTSSESDPDRPLSSVSCVRPESPEADVLATTPIEDHELNFLCMRHRPAGELHHQIELHGPPSTTLCPELREDIKRSLTMPMEGASFVGELLSREAIHPSTPGSQSPTTNGGSARRVSAPASRSPLAEWITTHHRDVVSRRVSEGGPTRISEGNPPLATRMKENTEPEPKGRGSIEPEKTTPEKTNHQIDLSLERETPPSSPASILTESPSSSSAPFDEDLLRPSDRFSRFDQRTLDEPEFVQPAVGARKTSRRRSISEPRGRTGGPGGVMGTAMKDAINNSYYTLNPGILEDNSVWGVAEFRRLCQMLNIDKSRCREWRDYLHVLQEWNLRPGITDNSSVTSTYHAGDIQGNPSNFSNTPILSVNVPETYRRVHEPLNSSRKLQTVLKQSGSSRWKKKVTWSPYNHNSQFYLSYDERYDKRLRLYEISSLTSLTNNDEGVDYQVVLIDPTRELNGDAQWEEAKSNMKVNLIRTNPNYDEGQDHSLDPSRICSSQDDAFR